MREPGPFGAMLRRHRTAAGLTREELASRAGLSVRGIAALENGERLAPRRDTMALLATALSLTPAEFEGLTAAGRVDRVTEADANGGGGRPARRSALPPQMTSFLGRTREVTAIAGLLQQPDVRLVTLTGPGGTGKTRLGVRVAEAVLPQFRDGAFLVSLAPLTDPVLVLPAIAQTLGVVEGGSRSLQDGLEAFLHARRLLLVLDNVEQVLAAAPALARLLEVSPGLTLLATSRAPLRLRAEREWPVPPLPLPARRGVLSAEALSSFEAVQLFVERAQAVSPEFALDDTNAGAVEEVCIRLDGLPLALELAAARIRLLPPRALARRLGDPLSLLVGGPTDAPERQQTLRAAIAWSYDLLEEPEQRLFEELAAFPGGCALDEVEALLDPDGRLDALRSVDALVKHSLLRVAELAAEAPRLTMLETIQQYALERLEERGRAEELRHRHAAHFLQLAQRAAPELVRGDQRRWLDRLEVDIDNLRAALERSVHNGDEVQALGLVVALARFWDRRNRYSEGRRWLTRALALPGAPSAARARASLMAGVLACRQGDLAGARAHLDQARALYEHLDDAGGVGDVLRNLAILEFYEGRTDESYRLTQQAVERLASAGPEWEWEWVYASIDLAACQALDLDLPEGLAQVEQALAAAEAFGDPWLHACVLGVLAEARARRGDRGGAGRLMVQVIGLAQRIGDRLVEAYALSGLAALAHLVGQHEGAARLWGAERQLRSSFGGAAHTSSWEGVETAMADARNAVGEQTWQRLVEEGRDLTSDDVLALARGTVGDT